MLNNLFQSHCAICGCGFSSTPPWVLHANADADGGFLQPHHVAPGGLDWMNDFIAMGDHPDSPWPGRVWILEKDASMEEPQGDADRPESYDLYFDQKDEPWVVVLHPACRDILCRYMKVDVADLSRDSLYACFKEFAQDVVVGRCLNVDYGNAQAAIGWQWTIKRGQEYLSLDPVRNSGLGELLGSMAAPPAASDLVPRGYGTDGDPFVRLPPEIRLEVLMLTDLVDIQHVRRASPAFANLSLGPGFWKRHLEADMPWLWDLPGTSPGGGGGGGQGGEVDWKGAHLALHRRTRYDAPNAVKMHGLCNRRRIWEQMCPVFAGVYRQHEANRARLGAAVPEAQYRRFTPHDVQVMMPPAESLPVADQSGFLDCCGSSLRMQGLLTFSEYMIDAFREIPSVDVSLRVDWTKEGYLASVYILRDGEMDTSSTRPRTYDVGRTDVVAIPAHDWLTGFKFTNRRIEPGEVDGERQVVALSILFTKQDPVQLGETTPRGGGMAKGMGDDMFVYPDDGWFVMGLRMQCFADGKLCRIALLQQPLDKAPPCPRLDDTRRHLEPYWARSLLWGEGLPPASITKAHTAATNEVIRKAHGHLHPHHVLLFGTTEEELADVTGVAVALDRTCFEVTYGHRAPRAIGPRLDDGDGVKRMEVEGAAGERVVGLYTLPGMLGYICLTTSWGRSMRVGGAPKDDFVNVEGADSISNAVVPYGLAAQWLGDSLKSLMLLVGPAMPGAEEIDRFDLCVRWGEYSDDEGRIEGSQDDDYGWRELEFGPRSI